MHRKLLDILCDPLSQESFRLKNEVLGPEGSIEEGILETPSGKQYIVKNGIPRFSQDSELLGSVKSFGNEWNHFNFNEFKANWFNHTVKNTFGSSEVFKSKVIVDAGGAAVCRHAGC